MILFIVGPTAVGKSQVAIDVADAINAEIISCDAMQVYREINIVSDKPTAQMCAQVPHHCIDIVSVEESFDVARFRIGALEAIDDVMARGKIPLIVGGSGMYISTLLDGIFDDVKRDDVLRARFEQLAELEGVEALHARLAEVDQESAKRIHPHDLKRTVRAMEVYAVTGKPISELRQQRNGLWGKQDIKIFALNREREELYRRAEARIDEMFANGLVDEIKTLNQLKLDRTVGQMIGFPEVIGYLNNEYDLSRTIYLMKRNTRHFVKRQLTWFRRDERLTWIDIDDQSPSDITQQIVSYCFDNNI